MRPEYPIRVTAWPPKGSGRGRGDAEARSAALRQALQVGTCRIAGHLPDFETHAVAWQSSQHQPDSLAAAVVAHDVLVAGSGSMQIVVPMGRLGDNRRPKVTDVTNGPIGRYNPSARRVGS